MDVSVIIPTYNRLWCLPKAVESCRNTRCNTEIIIVDDGSSDGTREWLETQQGVVVIVQENWGKCWAANKGFDLAKGKYIKFLDSDDRISANSIDEQFEIAEKSNADIVVSGYQLVDERDSVLRRQEWIPCNDFIAQQLGECDSSHYSAYLFKKSFINDIPHRPDFAFRDDRLFVLEAAMKRPTVSIHEGTALIHLHHSGERLQFNKGSQVMVQNYQHLKIYKKILQMLSERNELTPRRISASIKILWPLAHWIASSNLNEGVNAYKWIRELNPQFEIPQRGALGWLYKTLGFRKTEKLLNIRRSLKSTLT